MPIVDFSLQDRVALITGASRGIGRAIADGFIDMGAQVILSSRKQADLEKAMQEIESRGGRVKAIAAHMGKKEDIDHLVDQTLKHSGRIDILVNNAGTNPVFGPILDLAAEAWDKIMEVNLRGYFLCAQKVAQSMARVKRGVIINMASLAGLRSSPGMGAYCVSKAGVIMLTRVLAAELGPLGIRVNAIAPGVIVTKFSEALWKNPQIREEAEKAAALGRIGTVAEIVGAAVYLSSDASSYVSGETLPICGGSLA
jgi:NAD(P)-dependent dehydrogenase (short-subunit alcohol dehydrogenase family)